MKIHLFSLSLALAASAIFTASSSAQIVVTYKGDTGLINQQPGSSSDFIDFWSGNYYNQASHNGVVINGTTTSNLEAFSFAGGVTTQTPRITRPLPR